MKRRPVLSLGRNLPRPLVLIAEDDPVQRLVAWSMVQVVCNAGAAIACDGEDALEDVRHAEFDLILMDIQMPRLGGLAATLRIRQLERKLGRSPAPIVAYTSNLLDFEVADVRDFGMNHLLEKPASFEQMKACFQRWCRGYQR